MIIQWKQESIQGIRSDRVPEELWMEVRDIVQEADHPQEKEMRKSKMVV